MRIVGLERQHYPAFREMFISYYAELDCDDDPLHLLDEYVLPDFEANLLHIDIALCDDGQAAGFIVYQTDDPLNDWCFKDGWGDIREIFVTAARRGQGIGTQLVRHAETALSAEGASGIYTLPLEEAEIFFTKAGYSPDGGCCEELGTKVFIKDN